MQQQQQDLLTSNHYSTLGRASGPGTIMALGIFMLFFWKNSNNWYETPLLYRTTNRYSIFSLGTLNTSGGELSGNTAFQQANGIPPPLPSGGNHPAIAVGSSSTLMMPYNHKRGAANSQNHAGITLFWITKFSYWQYLTLINEKRI